MKQTYNTIERNHDIVLGNQDLELLHSFKNFPVFAGCVDHEPNDDILEDLCVYISRRSGMLQLNPILPEEIVYQQGNGTGSVGQSWLHHHRSFAEFIEKYKPHRVFEIAGGHGTLSKCYREINSSTRWTMIEPNPSVVDDPNIEVITGFFHNTSQIPTDVDMIVHILNPIEFVKSLNTLQSTTKLCFSVPALRMHLEQKFSSILNFEHTYLCTEEFIEWSLKNQGFVLLDKKVHDIDHSIFYAFEKAEVGELIDYSNSCYSIYKRLFKEYIDYNTNFINTVNDQIKNTESAVFLFGGHFISLFTIAFGLDISKITCIIDNSKIINKNTN